MVRGTGTAMMEHVRNLLAPALLLTALLVPSACGTGPAGPAAAPTPERATATAAPGPVAAVTVPAGVTPPPAGAVADYQLGGPYEPAADVRVVVRDRTAAPAPGLYSICYVNAFQTQPDENGSWFAQHPDLLLRDGEGRLVEDEGWPGEYLLDTSTPQRRAALAEVVGAWVDGCADAGYQAVEPDNLDSATRSGGALRMEDAYAFAALLAERAHARGLAFAQKNTPDTTAGQARAAGFDFAVAESCQVYAECDAYTAVHGDRVLEVEYSDDGAENFAAACAARGGTISVVYRDREVLPRGVPGYEFDRC
ncbi:endo alpha-1,4 polygalactosaminidase [Kineococcus sp. SYSU DK001]|uniref:endo alpha-1,4 polygalactosaminidase n=1 Tax=Kineococcus sp. SYSU DK001 TaxID=3383122 RepID=UPI003D7E507E